MGLDPELELALHHLELNKVRGLDFNSNLHMALEPGYPMIVIWSSLGGEKPRLMTKGEHYARSRQQSAL